MSQSEKIFLKKLCVLFRLAIVLTADRKRAQKDCKLSADNDDFLELEMPEGWALANPLIVANIKLEQEMLRKQGFYLSLK